MYAHECIHADGDEALRGKLILKFEFITAIDFILHELFAPSFVYGRFVILICAVCFSPPPS